MLPVFCHEIYLNIMKLSDSMSFLIVKCYKEFLISVLYYSSFTETTKATIF